MNKIIDVNGNNNLFHEGTADQGTYGLMPYTVYNGIDNYSHNQSGVLRGVTALTAGGWFNLIYGDWLMGAWLEPLNHCWRLYMDGLSPTFEVSEQGDDSFLIGGDNILMEEWNFIAGRYHSGEVALFVNGIKYTTATAPTSLYDATVGFTIGGDSEASFLSEGKFSNCFVCQASVPDNQLHTLFHVSKNLYGK